MIAVGHIRPGTDHPPTHVQSYKLLTRDVQSLIRGAVLASRTSFQSSVRSRLEILTLNIANRA